MNSRVTHKCSFMHSAVLFFAVLLFSFFPRPAYAAELSQSEIAARFEQIANTYSVGEELSEGDALFVRQYGTRPDIRSLSSTGIAPLAVRGSVNINASRTMYGVTATLTGNAWHNGTFVYTWGATLTGRVTSGATPRQMTVSATLQAFGVTSSGGLIPVYTNTLSNTSYNSKVVQMSSSDSYAGVIIVYYVNTQLDVTTASGSAFTVESNW